MSQIAVNITDFTDFYLSSQQNQDNSEDDQKSVGNRVGDGVAKCRNSASESFLHCAQSGCRLTRPGTTTQGYSRMKFENLVSDQNCKKQRHKCHYESGNEDFGSDLCKGTDK